VHGVAQLADLNIAFRPHECVLKIDRDASVVYTTSGRPIAYEYLLIATGASPRPLLAPGADLDGVHYLRTFQDALALSRTLARARNVVVIGGGFIGLEMASVAHDLGMDVTLVEGVADRVLARSAPRAIEAIVNERILQAGVQMLFGRRVLAFEGNDRLQGVRLSDNSVLPADAALIATGASPNDLLAREAGLQVENGVLTDEHCRTTDVAIFAAGDVANRLWRIPGHAPFYFRPEAWTPALEQGALAARTMLGATATPSPAPWIWSNLFGINLQFAGFPHLAHGTMSRQSSSTEVGCAVLSICDSRLVAAATYNAAKDMVYYRRAIGCLVNIEELANPDVRLREALAPIS
jgi:3-phenylpropionate/trans-cinnamate dioxygenase ferredoxin reductase subunit